MNMAGTSGDRMRGDARPQFAIWKDAGERINQVLAGDELALYCQPIVALHGGGFPMAEVLVRLREEEKKLLSPGSFLPVFEHYGRMPDLDRWVVRSVIGHIARGSRVPRFAINVSKQSLADAEFPKDVARELVSGGVSGTTLVFEIDEADSLARPDAAIKFVRGIRAVGCRLALDGFGRSSTSVAALRTLQVDFLKVDGSIVRRLLTDPKADAKLRAFLKFGQATGVELVAEMVEDQDILVRLKALGVAYAQGYGICQPHPIELLSRQGAARARAG